MFPLASPIDEQTFSRLMQAVGPFEIRPRIAVAVSGGPDSMALCVLLVRWMRCNGGETVALTVDHQRSPETLFTDFCFNKQIWTFFAGIKFFILL